MMKLLRINNVMAWDTFLGEGGGGGGEAAVFFDFSAQTDGLPILSTQSLPRSII